MATSFSSISSVVIENYLDLSPSVLSAGFTSERTSTRSPDFSAPWMLISGLRVAIAKREGMTWGRNGVNSFFMRRQILYQAESR